MYALSPLQKKIPAALIGALLATASTAVLAAPPAAETIDLKKVNQVIEKIASEAVPADEVIESVSAAFDTESTDIEQARINATVSAKVKTTPWDRGAASSLAIHVATQAAPIEGDDAHVRLSLDARAAAKTEVLKLIRFASGKALEQNTGSATGGLDEASTQKLLALTRELTTVETLDRVHAILVDAKKTLLESTLPADQKQAITDTEITTETAENAVRAIEIRYAKSVETSFVPGLTFSNIGARIDAHEARIGLTVSVPQLKEELEQYKQVFKQALLSIQSESAETIEQVKGVATGYAELVRGYLKDALN